VTKVNLLHGSLAALFLLLASLLAPLTAQESQSAAKDDPLQAVLSKPAMENLDDLRILEKQTRYVVDKVMPCVVGIQIGFAMGSGVIVTEDGYVLTAAHVSGQADRNAVVIMPDGKRLKAKTLGTDLNVDGGLIKITDEGKFPYVEMGKSSELKRGQWCLALGHEKGVQPGRSPPVRLGRILRTNTKSLCTDCTLVSGDSGGPLFDLYGNVIGIHSNIGPFLTVNNSVAVDNYRDNWDRLVKGESWGGFLASAPNGGYLGMSLSRQSEECLVSEVSADSPAAKAGIKVGDVVVKFDNQKIAKADEFLALIARKKPGDEAPITIRRSQETLDFRITIGKKDK
jgi:serine protease Do